MLPRLYLSLTTTATWPKLMGGNAATPKRPGSTRGEYTNSGKSPGGSIPWEEVVSREYGCIMGPEKLDEGGSRS